LLQPHRVADPSRLRDELRPPGPVEFSVERHEEPEVIALDLHGELDLMTSPKFATVLGESIRLASKNVVVDLDGLSFIDSAGLHVLLNAQRRLTRHSRRLIVRCGPGPVRRAIELSRLAGTFGLEPLAPEPDAAA
jgi:anti-sigma B factor antagonist